MNVLFCISGSVVAKSGTGIVPSVGTEATIRMETYKEGMEAGTVLKFTVSEDFPPHYDYTADAVYVNLIDWDIHKFPEDADD